MMFYNETPAIASIFSLSKFFIWYAIKTFLNVTSIRCSLLRTSVADIYCYMVFKLTMLSLIGEFLFEKKTMNALMQA